MASIQKAIVFVVALAVCSTAFSQKKKPKMMPYTTEDHPQFLPASQATFLANNDLVIGVSRDGVTKAYPAADLAQHGDVQDQMPDGPIAVTW